MSYWKLTVYAAFSLCALFTAQGNAQASFTEKGTGKSFPESVAVEYKSNRHQLEATGSATRKKFFVKIYGVAHYMEDPIRARGDRAFDEIINAKKAKQLSIKWARNASVKQVQDGYHESFNKALSRNEQQQFDSDVNKFIEFFKRPVRDGDHHIINWLPDGTVQVFINGNSVGTIKNEAFAKGLWKIWFGHNSVVDRADLVSKIR
jgi:hypothetical protein